MSTQKPWRVRRARRLELRKSDALEWKGKPNVPVKEPQHVAGYDPDDIEKRIVQMIKMKMEEGEL